MIILQVSYLRLGHVPRKPRWLSGRHGRNCDIVSDFVTSLGIFVLWSCVPATGGTFLLVFSSNLIILQMASDNQEVKEMQGNGF